MASKSAAPAAPQAKKEASANNYVAVVIAIVVLIVIACLVIGKSEVSSLIVNTKVIAGDLQAKHDLDTKLANIPTLLSNYKNLGSKQQLISDGLPTTSDFPQIVSMMQGISSSAGVQLRSVSPAATGSSATAAPAAPGAAATGSSAQPYDFTVSITGSYASIVSFFQNTEISDRPLKVMGANFSGDSSTIAATVQLETYYQGTADISDKTEPVK